MKKETIDCIRNWDLVIPMQGQAEIFEKVLLTWLEQKHDPHFYIARHLEDLAREVSQSSKSLEEMAEEFAYHSMMAVKRHGKTSPYFTDDTRAAYTYAEQRIEAIENHIAAEKLKKFMDKKFQEETAKEKEDNKLQVLKHEREMILKSFEITPQDKFILGANIVSFLSFNVLNIMHHSPLIVTLMFASSIFLGRSIGTLLGKKAKAKRYE